MGIDGERSRVYLYHHIGQFMFVRHMFDQLLSYLFTIFRSKSPDWIDHCTMIAFTYCNGGVPVLNRTKVTNDGPDLLGRGVDFYLFDDFYSWRVRVGINNAHIEKNLITFCIVLSPSIMDIFAGHFTHRLIPATFQIFFCSVAER